MTTYELTTDNTIIQQSPIDKWVTISVENEGGDSIEVFRPTMHTARNTFSYFSEIQKTKEKLYITGIDNLIKKNNLLQHSVQLAEGFITEEEFEREIEENPDNFIISIREPYNLDELIVLKDIVKKIGRQFSVDEVSEIFSISLNNYNKFLNQ